MIRLVRSDRGKPFANDLTIHGHQGSMGPRSFKLLDGKQEAQVIVTRLGPPPEGYGKWSLRLLSRRVVELEIVESVSYETLRRTLKKTA